MTADDPAATTILDRDTWEHRARRHPLPLRLSPAETRAVVEEQAIVCSHYDAFRFFTRASEPLNRLKPTRANRIDLEQAGCIHANMDLYKWCYKLGKLIPSELLADAFDLAWHARIIDMRAGPYGLSPLGFDPIPIETETGRTQYEHEQRNLANQATPIRQNLLTLCSRIQNGYVPYVPNLSFSKGTIS